METVTPLDTLCRIMLRAREYEAQVPTDYDEDESPDNVDGDDDSEAYSVLDDDLNTSVEDELQSALEDLADDQLIEVLALCWVGQGDYDAPDWEEALEAAGEEEQDIIEMLLEMPMLASLLEGGLAAFDLNCDGVGTLS